MRKKKLLSLALFWELSLAALIILGFAMYQDSGFAATWAAIRRLLVR